MNLFARNSQVSYPFPTHDQGYSESTLICVLDNNLFIYLKKKDTLHFLPVRCQPQCHAFLESFNRTHLSQTPIHG